MALVHGEARRGVKRSTEWHAWNGMQRRCYQESNPKYRLYGARGITVCFEWRNSFLQFLNDVGRKPSKEYSLGRIDNNGNYEPGNVRWETAKQQALNTRHNRLLTYEGCTMSLCKWSEKLNLKRTTITQRLDAYGWTVEKTLSTPTKTRK